MMDILHARADGTFVIRLHGHPYHVVESDPLFPVVAAAADGQEFPAEAVPVDAPPMASGNVSLRQLLRALAATGFISKAEALAAARTGDIPASLSAPLFAAVDADAAFEIELTWAAMYQAERASPFWAYVVAAGIATAAQIDEVFAVAAAS